MCNIPLPYYTHRPSEYNYPNMFVISDSGIGFEYGETKIRNAEKFADELEPAKVIFNFPATIVYWNDGSKTVVKLDKKIKESKAPKNWKEQGFLNAFAKRCNPKYVDMMSKWVDGYK